VHAQIRNADCAHTAGFLRVEKSAVLGYAHSGAAFGIVDKEEVDVV
jgi:hypothetical protein